MHLKMTTQAAAFLTALMPDELGGRRARKPMITGTQSRLRAMGIALMAFACSSCATRPMQGVLVPTVEAVSGSSRIPILLATTRQRSSNDPGEMFSSERADAISYAKVVISIPPGDNRKVGEIQWPASPPGDPQRDFVTVSADYINKREFGAAITSVGKESHRNKAMIFVHGFNNRLDDAAYRLAQIVQDSKAPVIPILFSWPSRGVVDLRAYEYDRESSTQSSDELEQLIDTVALSPRVNEVTIVCHSMGCALTLEALHAKAMRDGKIGDKVRNVLLVAPDVDANHFRAKMHEMGNARPRFVLLLSQDDHALKISKVLWGGATRLGDVDPRFEPYKSDFQRERIVVFDLTHLNGDAHSRAFDEVQSVMGMIERRLAEGQQLDEDPSRTVVASR
jgi:esterase/lipase superfamily enzyme